MAGCIGLIAGDFDKAKEYFEDAIQVAEAIQELIFRARSERALGEIAIVHQDMITAKAYFDTTSKLCEIMGIPKDFMYPDFARYQLNETFDGWNLYQEGHPMFTAQADTKGTVS